MRPRRGSWPPRAEWLFVLALAPALLGASFSVAELTRSAGLIFRGTCVDSRPWTADLKGRPLPATAYTFEVKEYLKGNGPRRLTFRQAGTPERGTSDLGRIAGLTVFAPEHEYVVFLRPESKAGLTSAAGRGRGVLLVQDETAQVADASGLTPEAGAERIAYEALRRAVLQVLQGPPRSR